jgi:S-DNA-T family DNA segregation ATPase FtsK/SpoIIIE
MSSRRHLLRWSASLGLAVGYVLLVLALVSFKPTDWPSHAVYPHTQTQNLVGDVGAMVAYALFSLIGAGVWAFALFGGVYVGMKVWGQVLGDIWLRVIGLTILAVSLGAITHLVAPGSSGGFPEGNGGVVGIAAAQYLKSQFHSTGAGLLLVAAFVLGLMLTADELVIRVPTYVNSAYRKFKPMPINQPIAFPPEPKVKVKKEAVAPIEEEIVEIEPEEPPVVETKVEAEASAASPTPTPADEPPLTKRDIVVRLPSTNKPKRLAPPPPKELGEYLMPDWEVLADAEHGYAESQEQLVREKAAVLEAALQEFGIEAHVTEIDTGPVITMYELSLAPGIRVSAITALSNDIARALSATNVRVVAPIPGKNTVGIEVPNNEKEKVRLKELMQLAPEATNKMAIPLYLGKDASGEPLITDLAGMPHCLIAGTTGSGKSVCINTVIMSVLYTQRPDMVKLILVDPKIVEMAPFKDIPHLMCPVITETGKATAVLEWACEKMDERYAFLAEAGVRNIAGYNKLTKEELFERFNPTTPEEEAKVPKKLPYIVIIIDELADLMMTSGKEVESSIVRIAQKARAVGIHLILATQRPQATVVTGLIKSNMPSKIAFRVASRMDSRIVMDQNGAELLLGQGDMLFLPPGASKPVRSQGTYIDDKEIRESVRKVKELAEQQFEPELVQIKSVASGDASGEKDELFDEAVRVVLETKRGSVSLLQRRLTIGYGRASRIIEQMAEAGILGEHKGSQAREPMISLEDWEAIKAQQQNDEQSGMAA